MIGTSGQAFDSHRVTFQKAGRVFWYILRLMLLLGLCFVILYPLIYMLSMAFRPVKEVYDPAVIWVPKSFTMANIKAAIKYMDYFVSFRNSFVVHIVSSFIQTLMCAITGYGFARFQFRGKKLLFAVVILTILVPSQLTITPMAHNFSFFDFFGIGRILSLFRVDISINLLDSPLAFYLPALFASGIKAGLFIFIFRQFFRGLPVELEDAAAIDGCGFIRTFTSVIMPNALSVCLTVVILSVVWYWNDYFYSSMFLPNYQTVSMALANLGMAYGADHYGADPSDVLTLMQAGSLLAILPLLFMYLFLQRFFVQGVERSGIVG